MTDAMQAPLPAEAALSVHPEPTVCLLRGGEVLALDKVNNRFTLCPAAGATLADVIKPLGNVAATPILLNSLIEVETEPDQLEALMQMARTAPTVGFASHVYHMRQSPGTLLYLTDQITLQFNEQVTSTQMQSLIAPLGLRILKLIAGVPKAFVFQVASAAVNPLKLAQQLIQHPEILLAEPNVAVLRQDYYRPRESDYAKQWYLHHEGGEALTAGSHLFAEAAWNVTRGKRSVAVAVVDDGVDLNHPDFQSEGKIVAPVDLQDGGFLPLPQNGDRHGTAVAQLAVADETGKGIVGVAPNCALMPIRIGKLLDDQVLEQICQWVVDKKADVVCCGWGIAAVYFPLSLRQRVALAQAATQGREGRGCPIIFAAGNANRPLDGVIEEQGWAHHFLQGATRWLNGLAIHPDVIAVGACTSQNQKSACSNWGQSLSIAAPGGHAAPILETQQTGVIATAPILASPQVGKAIELDRSSQTDEQPPAIGDTSAAAALVAGVVALMLSVNPDLTGLEVQQILAQSADKIVDREPDAQLGLRLGEYDANRHSNWFGYGKLNAVKAVQLAQRKVLPLPLPSRWLEYAQRHRLDIPDGDPRGVSSTIQVSEPGLIQDIEISVEIQHAFIGDLELFLIPPWGESIPLQSRALGRLTTLKTTYSLETTLWLKTVLNRPARGQWQLQIIDWVPESTGYLQKWQLNLGI